VGVRRAQHGGVQQARRTHVVDEPAGAGGEPVAAEPRMRLADHRCAVGAWPVFSKVSIAFFRSRYSEHGSKHSAFRRARC